MKQIEYLVINDKSYFCNGLKNKKKLYIAMFTEDNDKLGERNVLSGKRREMIFLFF